MNESKRLELINAWLDGEVDAAPACAQEAASSPELVAEARAQRRMHVMLWAQLTPTSADTVALRVKILESGTATRKKSVNKIMRRIHPRSPLVWLGWSMAATLLVMVIGGLLAWPRLIQIAELELAGGVVQRDQQTIPAHIGLALRANDEIQATSTTRLHFNDGTIFTIEPGTSLRLLAGQHRLGGNSKRAELLSGHLFAEAAHQPNGEPLIIVTPDIELTVVGTVFTVITQPGSTHVDVSSGRVQVRSDDGMHEIAAGQHLRCGNLNDLDESERNPAAVANQSTKIDMPKDASHQARMENLLAWCREDAEAAQAIGMTDLAKERQADVDQLTKHASTETPPLPVDDVLPPIPITANNPVFTNAIASVRSLITQNRTFPKGPEGGKGRSAEGWTFINRATEMLELVQVFCHPQSPLRGDAALVKPILRRVAFFAEYMATGGPVLGDFGPCNNIADAYLILRTCRPEIIPDSLRKSAENGIKNNAEVILTNHKSDYLSTTSRQGLINGDVRYSLTLALTDRILKRPEYAAAFIGSLRFMSTNLMPDGGTNYIGTHNENPSYHAITVECLTRAWQITKRPDILDMLKRMRWYYPLSVEPRGAVEWNTATNWHHYWNGATGADAAAILANLLHCPHNQRIANLGYRGDLWQAAFWNPTQPASAWDDRYLVYDRNIEGPRGRFGDWSFSATTRRDFHDSRGKSSYVGCMLTTAGAKGWPVDAAVQDVGMEVRLTTGAEPPSEHRGRLAFANDEPVVTSSTGERAAALGSVSRLGSYAKPAQPWLVRQAWLLTPERMVGVVELEAESAQKAAGCFGDLFLVSGRSSWGTRKELKKLTDNTLGYGALTITIIAHDFTDITHEYAEAMGGSILHNTISDPNLGKSCRLLLRDEFAVKNLLTAYPKGTKHYFAVEIRPATSSAAPITQHHDNGLMNIEVNDGTGRYQLVFNATSKPIAWNVPFSGQLHKSGECFRPTWIAEAGPVPSIAPIPAVSRAIEQIPAGEIRWLHQAR